jgi:osmotically inducible protein OsmC
MKNKNASVDWQGTIKAGQGKVSTESGALKNAPYSFSTRFGEDPGTNPEELVGAALASCFSMAFAAQLQKQKITPEQIHTEVEVEMKQHDEAWSVTDIRIETSAQAEGISASELQEAAEVTRRNCPIAKLMNANVTVEATLMSAEDSQGRNLREGTRPHATH